MEDRDLDRDHGADVESVAGPAAAAHEEEDEVVDGGDEGFSFPVPPLAADGFIVPVYPVFGRPLSPPPVEDDDDDDEPETATVRVPLGRLLLEEREFRARQRRPDDEGGGELEGVAPESYCLWAPGQPPSTTTTPASPRWCRKSGSTGSVLRWRRISERLVRRSQSDGKEKFVFLNAAAGPSPHPPKENSNDNDVAGGKRDGDGRHGWRYYSKGGGGGGSGGRRKSYLPYKQEIVGLFANVSGLRRSYHPF
uniref:Uncharacterized protein n=1 Tax=Leersia perrieri TaxID=77586 RepID=A0A0D9V3S5_9ORYZ